ncbi:ABC transporter permease subunit [bacterium]|nr:ABC transporter permease subunit [bacterium]
MGNNKWHRSALTLMLLPYVVGLVGLILVPSALSIVLAFARFDALTAPTWIGSGNVERLFSDRLFGIALGNTLVYLVLAVLFRILGALGLALLLQRTGRMETWTRSAVFSPTVIPDVAYALVWLVAFNPRYGPVNLVLGLLGLPTPAWIVEPGAAMLALVIMATWQLGEGFVVLLASLNEIPAGLMEAGALDGASAWQRFRHITFPLLLPRLLLLTARDLIVNLQASFVPTLLVTRGGPGYATLLLPLYSYQLAFDDLRFGYAATVVWALYLITVLVIVVQSLLSRRLRYEGSFGPSL